MTATISAVVLVGTTSWALAATAPMSAPALNVSATTTSAASSTASGIP